MDRHANARKAREFGGRLRGELERSARQRDYAMRVTAVRVGCVPVSVHDASFPRSETVSHPGSFPVVGAEGPSQCVRVNSAS